MADQTSGNTTKTEAVYQITLQTNQQQNQETTNSINNVAKSIIGLKNAAVVYLASQFLGFMNKQALFVTSLSSLSSALGVSVNQLQVLSLASKNVGEDANLAEKGVASLAQQLNSIRVGGDSKGLLNALGILHGMAGGPQLSIFDPKTHQVYTNSYHLFMNIASAIGRIKNAAQGRAITQQIFGDPTLYALFQHGTSDFNYAYQQLLANGALITKQQQTISSGYTKMWNGIVVQLQGGFRQLGTQLYPIMEQIAKIFSSKAVLQWSNAVNQGFQVMFTWIYDILWAVQKLVNLIDFDKWGNWLGSKAYDLFHPSASNQTSTTSLSPLLIAQLGAANSPTAVANSMIPSSNSVTHSTVINNYYNTNNVTHNNKTSNTGMSQGAITFTPFSLQNGNSR